MYFISSFLEEGCSVYMVLRGVFGVARCFKWQSSPKALET